MSQSSSTSSSDAPGRYLLIAALLSLGALAAVAAVSFTVKWRTELTEAGALVAFQQRRLEAGGPVDTVFVGDSSLGNAIDAAEFDRLTGTRSVNLALNGMFGYAGSYNMIRRALAARPQVRNVVIVQTVDMMARPVSYNGYLFSAPDARMDGLEPATRWALAKTFGGELLDWKPLALLARRAVQPDRPPLRFAGDYIRQGPPLRARALRGIAPDALLNDKDTFLRAIARLCGERKLNCVYAYGPLSADKLARSRGFVEASSRRIAEAGFAVAAPPLPLSPERLGDSEDHVAPAWKKAATAYYARRLRPKMGQQAHLSGEWEGPIAQPARDLAESRRRTWP